MSQQNEISSNLNTSSNSFNVTKPMLLSLRQTKPWVMLLSIIGFIYTGLMLIVAIVSTFVFSKFDATSALPSSLMFTVIYILMGIVYFFPSLFLFKFASSIGSLLDGGGAAEMEAALSNQKSFWKFVGILILISIVLGILGIAAAIVIPLFVQFAS